MSECECDSFVFSFGCFFSLYVAAAAAAAAAFETHVYCYLDVIFAFCQYSFCSDVYVFWFFMFFACKVCWFFVSLPFGCFFFVVFLKVVVYSV